MARKLSEITRRTLHLCVVLSALVAAQRASADDATPTASTPRIVRNPFADQNSVVPPSAAQPATLRSEGTHYRNPFTKDSSAPPIQSPMLHGPMNRWRRGTFPHDEPSAVRAAILSADPLGNIDALIEPPDPARFAPTPLVQPAWLASDARPLPPIDRASFNQPIVPADSAPIIATDLGDSPQELLNGAQQAASTARTPAELSAVAALCERGLASKPNVEVATSLRRLAAWAHNLRGEQLAADDQPAQALEAFQNAIALDANCSLALHNRAVTLAEQNQPAAALVDFNRVVELNPGLAVAHRNRAELLAAMGRVDEAVADYSRAIDLLPDDAELYAARGYARQRLGDFDRAAVDYDRALQIAPDQPVILAQRGNLAAEQGALDRAVADFQQAIAIDPQCAEAHRSLAWLRATCADEDFRDANEALVAANHALALAAPDEYLVLEALAAAYAAAAQFEDAVRVQQQAIEAAPPERREILRQRQLLYRAKKPFHSDQPFARRSPSPRDP
jgi:tetratricopeptide (TPR) repeat protein